MFSSCLGKCLPQTKKQQQQQMEQKQVPAPRQAYYNQQLRTNLGLVPRPLQLPIQTHEESAHADASAESAEAPSAPRSRSHSPPEPKPERLPPSAGVPSSGGGGGSVGRSPSRSTAASKRQPREWANTSMTTEELGELFATLHRTIEGVPYAICGLAALVDHGFRGRRAKQISILCPAYSKDNVGTWAAAKGFERRQDSIGLPLRDGSVRRIRVKYLDDGFQRLERVPSQLCPDGPDTGSGRRRALVLSLASQLDNVAAGWVDARRRGDAEGLATVAGDVFWCLRKAEALPRHERAAVMDPKFLTTLLGEDFFLPFCEAHPGEARPALLRAGVDVAGVVAALGQLCDLREHEALLRQFGCQPEGGLVAERQPGLFEGIRDLANSRSVYTLRGSVVFEGEDDVPELPGLPSLPVGRPGRPSRRPSDKSRGRVVTNDNNNNNNNYSHGRTTAEEEEGQCQGHPYAHAHAQDQNQDHEGSLGAQQRKAGWQKLARSYSTGGAQASQPRKSKLSAVMAAAAPADDGAGASPSGRGRGLGRSISLQRRGGSKDMGRPKPPPLRISGPIPQAPARPVAEWI
ncbi:hypothetical protein GGR56DRAFT_696551 [Xylariaceae sp. FL0804]|nr:hypothetical protein GGR56DRAFT_696551 [Xylariaceae sp. FL0804]